MDKKKLINRWAQLCYTARERNSAYDHWGMGWTPERVDPLLAELIKLHIDEKELEQF